MCPFELKRTRQLEAAIPDIWQYRKYLYVGANENRFHYAEPLREMVLRGQGLCDVVEIDPQRRLWVLENHRFVRDVFLADVCFWSFGGSEHYDVILWSHGPSCIPSKAGLERCLKDLKKMCKLLVLMCPWGIYHKTVSDLDYDSNHQALYPEFFTRRGFSVNTIGEKDVNGSNLLAWWRRHG